MILLHRIHDIWYHEEKARITEEENTSKLGKEITFLKNISNSHFIIIAS
jgi:hypothetical protein